VFAELPVEELDLPDLHLVQVDLHLAREVESAAKERHGIDLHAADAVHQLGQFVDMLDQLIQSFLVAHKCIVEGGIYKCMYALRKPVEEEVLGRAKVGIAAWGAAFPPPLHR
jgi:hypothetical protein